MSGTMFEFDQDNTQKKLMSPIKSLLPGFVLTTVVFSSLVFSQSENVISELPSEPLASHIISNVTVSPIAGEHQGSLVLDEGYILSIGDIVRTGEDSMLRILFPDGTTETLCENESYQVREVGSEVYDDDDATSLVNIIAAFNRCKIRPRFIERCRDENGFISKYTKAGERRKVGILDSQEISPSEQGTNDNKELQSVDERVDENFEELDYAFRCTTGERLYIEYAYVPSRNDIQTISVQVPQVPAPTDEPVTLPEVGGSPVQ